MSLFQRNFQNISTLFCLRDADLDVPVRVRGHREAELEDNLGPDLATQGASLETGRVSGQSVRIITGKNSSSYAGKLDFYFNRREQEFSEAAQVKYL